MVIFLRWKKLEYIKRYEIKTFGNIDAWNAYAETTHTGTSEAYKKKDEEFVITGIEQRTALLLGEIEPGQVTRTNHNGKPVSVESPISNKKIEE